jgi:hypothetical protein
VPSTKPSAEQRDAEIQRQLTWMESMNYRAIDDKQWTENERRTMELAARALVNLRGETPLSRIRFRVTREKPLLVQLMWVSVGEDGTVYAQGAGQGMLNVEFSSDLSQFKISGPHRAPGQWTSITALK